MSRRPTPEEEMKLKGLRSEPKPQLLTYRPLCKERELEMLTDTQVQQWIAGLEAKYPFMKRKAVAERKLEAVRNPGRVVEHETGPGYWKSAVLTKLPDHQDECRDSAASVTFDGFETFLKSVDPRCAKWIPLIRDGEQQVSTEVVAYWYDEPPVQEQPVVASVPPPAPVPAPAPPSAPAESSAGVNQFSAFAYKPTQQKQVKMTTYTNQKPSPSSNKRPASPSLKPRDLCKGKSKMPRTDDVPIGVPIAVTKTGRPFKTLTRGDQLESACGMNTALVKYARDNYGNTPGGISTSQVRAWYEKDLDNRLPSRFKGKKFGVKKGDLQVCHIMSKAKGGHDWVFNYFIDLQDVNKYFDKYQPKEWDDYVGKDASTQAETFARWVSLRAKAALTFGACDPMADHFMVRQ